MPVDLGSGFGRLADTLRLGFKDIGNRELRKSDLALQGARLDYEIRKDKPRLELANMQLAEAQRKQARDKSPFMVNEFVDKTIGPIDINNPPSERILKQYDWASRKIIPNAATAIGTTYDPESRMLIKADGTPLSNEEWEHPRIQNIIKGVIGTFTDRERGLELDAKDPTSPNHEKAKELLKMRDENPVEFFRHEVDTRTEAMNMAMMEGVPENTLGVLKAQIKTAQDKLDKVSDLMSPKQKEEWDLKKTLTNAQIEEARAKKAAADKEDQETYVELGDKGEIIGVHSFGKKTPLPKDKILMPVSDYAKLNERKLSDIDKITLGNLKSNLALYDKKLINFDSTLDQLEKAKIVRNFLQNNPQISEKQFNKNKVGYTKQAVDAEKARLVEERDALKQQIDSFEIKNPLEALRGNRPQQQVTQPTGQGNVGLTGPPTTGQGNVVVPQSATPDLALDLDKLDRMPANHPRLQEAVERMKKGYPGNQGDIDRIMAKKNSAQNVVPESSGGLSTEDKEKAKRLLMALNNPRYATPEDLQTLEELRNEWGSLPKKGIDAIQELIKRTRENKKKFEIQKPTQPVFPY